MKAIVRRLTLLEQSCRPDAHLRCQRGAEVLWERQQRRLEAAEVLWERQQRRLEAAGLPFETVKPEYSPGPYLSCAESLRRCLQERRARQQSERETADNGA